MIRRCRKKWLTFYIVGQVRLFKISLSNVEINQVYDYDAMEKVNLFTKNLNNQSINGSFFEFHFLVKCMGRMCNGLKSKPIVVITGQAGF